MTGLRHPELLRVAANGGGYFMGGSQEWFPNSWQRKSGCGPTTASGIMWYLSRSRPELEVLRGGGDGNQKHFLRLMEEMFRFVTPGPQGVNKTSTLSDGAAGYARSKGIVLRADILDVPPAAFPRPSVQDVREFLSASFAADCPAAFLNLSNGTLRNLSSWHWVLLIALEPASMTATMCDQCARTGIALGEWLRSTALGGGFVALALAGETM